MLLTGLGLSLVAAAVTSTHRRTIVGGRVADPRRYPYFVRLLYDDNVGCGGTLVWTDFVLTAAHCIYPGVDWRRITAVIENSDGEWQTSKIHRVVPHPVFDDDTDQYDVALLQIDPVNDASFVRLATPDEFVLEPSDEVTVIGFGATTDEGDNSEVLREVGLQVLDDRECSFQYREGKIHFPSMICAADVELGGPCYRDSGGPLLVLGDDIAEENVTQLDVQVGIVSFGGGRCGDPEQASVYSDVGHAQPWIEDEICRYSVAPPLNCESFDNNYTTSDAPPSRNMQICLVLLQLVLCRVFL